MLNTFKTAFILFTLFISNSDLAAKNQEISIQFIGNCGLYMTDGDLHIYSDFPYQSGAYNYMEYDSTQLEKVHENSIFLFTHKHKDHYSGKLMRRILKEKKGKKYGSWNISALEKIGEDNPNFKIEAFKTKHRFTLRHYSYLITWHGKKIYLSGDTESAETIGKMKNLDWAFIPPWIVYDAKEKGIEIDSKMKAIYHLYPNQMTNNEIPSDIILLNKENYTISISLSKNFKAKEEEES